MKNHRIILRYQEPQGWTLTTKEVQEIMIIDKASNNQLKVIIEAKLHKMMELLKLLISQTVLIM